MAGPKHSELPAVVVPQHLWLRSPRPVQGKVVQWAVPGVLVLIGLLMSTTPTRVSFVLAGFGVFLLLPGLVTGRLEALGREVLAADRSRASELITELPTRPIVRLFAPAAWRTLQLALLNLKLGDGHAAAAGFAETAELCGQPEAVMLISAQAHAHVLAGERGKARDLLQKLTTAGLLGPRDQLDLGIVLAIESKKFKQALAYVEAARKTIGDNPRILAAQALALQKLERIDEASVLLEQVQIAIKDAAVDPVTDDLIKRARKGLQDYLEAQLRRERRARSRRTTIVVSSEAAASEIVSGEIGSGGEPTATETALNDARSEIAEPTRRFVAAETGPMASAPVPAAAPPKPTAPIERDPDAPHPGLEIDLFSMPHTSAPPLSELLRDRNSDDSKPRIDSVAAALSSEVPAGPMAPPSLIVPDIGHTPLPVAPPIIGVPRVGGTMPFTPGAAPELKSERPAAPAAVPPAPAPRATSLFMAGPVTPAASAPEAKPDSDAPMVRRRQTLLGVLPTNEPSKPPAPSLPSLNNVSTPPHGTALPRTGLPTRGTTRLDLPAIGSTPSTGPSPVFRAPPKPKSDEK